MTDKVQKIREEVERLYNQSLADENRQTERGLERAANVSYGKSKACNELISFIDSLQEEPKPKKCMFTLEEFTDEDRKVLCEDCDDDCEYAKKVKLVSDELEDAAIEICSKILKGETVIIDGYEYIVISDAEECFKAGAKWQKEKDNEEKVLIYKHGFNDCKEQMIAKAMDAKVIANGMGNPILHLWDKGRHLIGKKVKVIVIKED